MSSMCPYLTEALKKRKTGRRLKLRLGAQNSEDRESEPGPPSYDSLTEWL
jgi:hypothetical protein